MGLRPPKVTKTPRSSNHFLWNRRPFLCHPDRSEAERRDLQFPFPRNKTSLRSPNLHPTTDIDYEHMSAEKRLLELGLTLPEPPAPGGNYVSAKTLGNLVYLSGVISTDTNGIIAGTAGADRTIPEGYAAARACALTQLAVLKRTLGSLDKVREIVSVNGYVNAIAGFPDSPAIINGASDLLIAVFQDQGRHVRAAVGVSALPRNALVEMQMIVAV
jgi:enamine deaminase RidA (YjgF/YER057c/UK114 family)